MTVFSPSSVPQNVVVMDSTNPRADATDMMTLFPNKFVMETSMNGSSGAVSLLEKNENDESIKQSPPIPTALGVLIIFVPCKSRSNTNDSSSNHTRSSPYCSSPVRATLIMTERQIRTAVMTCTKGNGTDGSLNSAVKTFKSLKVVDDEKNDNGTGTYTVINFGGGSSALVVTPELIASKEGRMMLTKFAASPQELMNLFSNDDTSDSSTTSSFQSISSNEPFTDIAVNDNSINDNGRAIMTEDGMEEGKEDMVIGNEVLKDAPKFSTLDVSLMQMNGQLEPNTPLNSRVGIPVETELFVGSIILILRPINPEDDPYYNEKIFSKKKRRIIVQIQGKFKKVPAGTLFVGGEISDVMKLGLLTKGVAGILLKLLRAFYPELHFSFGDRKKIEAPHIVFPAHQFFENVHITKPGDHPPSISDMFTETDESRKSRRAAKNWIWNTEDTYSMGFHSMHLDLATWRVVHVPMTGDLALRTFWGNSFLTLVMYENSELKNTLHRREKNKYYFAMKINFLGLNASVSPEEEALSEEEETVTVPIEGPSLVRGDSFIAKALERNVQQQSQVFLSAADADSDNEDYFFDAAEADIGLGLEDELFVSARSSSLESGSTRMNTNRSNSIDLCTIDKLCPAWIEISSSKGKYATVYAFNFGDVSGTVYRKSSQFLKEFNVENSTDDIEALCSPRLSSAERHRRIMGHTLLKATANTTDETIKGKIIDFQKLETPFESTFLQKQSPLLPSSKVKDSILIANVARALHERHWVEEVVRIHGKKVSFYPLFKQKPTHRISLQNIVKVSTLSRNKCPEFPLNHFMAIETLGRTIYLMFKNEKDRDEWVQLLTKISTMPSSPSKSQVQKGNAESRISSDMVLMIDDPTDEFLHKPSLWNCKQRRILNCRKFLFNGSHDSTAHSSPSNLVEDALRRALDPVEEEHSEEKNLRAFLNSACELKGADLSKVANEKERLAFFLNLYHVMIMHAFLVLGPPDSNFKWLKYFNMISYQCSDDIFSLAELEHCIIRAAMNYPSQFISKFVLPKSQYFFGLTKGDYRVNFALNCGSSSNPGFVPIYTADQIDMQLDKTAAAYLQRVVEFKKPSKSGGGLTVILPRVCQWFADDFANGSNESVLRSVQKYLDPAQQDVLSKITWLGDVSVKYLNFSFECSNLMLEEEEQAVNKSLS